MTPAPTVGTSSPTESGGGVSIETWVFFALFLFLALTSRYFARLAVALTKGLPLGNVLKSAIKKDLEWPLFLGLVALFLYLALVVFLPISGLWIELPVFYVVRLWVCLALTWPSDD
jgi:hypothetical protein